MGDFVGRRVKKEVEGVGTLSGTVKSYNSGTGGFEIVYDSGDSEALDLSQLNCLLNESQEQQQQREPVPSSTVGRKPKKKATSCRTEASGV